MTDDTRIVSADKTEIAEPSVFILNLRQLQSSNLAAFSKVSNFMLQRGSCQLHLTKDFGLTFRGPGRFAAKRRWPAWRATPRCAERNMRWQTEPTLFAVSNPYRCLALDREVCPAGEWPHEQTSGEIRGEIRSRPAGPLPLRSSLILAKGGWKPLERQRAPQAPKCLAKVAVESWPHCRCRSGR
jgi:hypothetical protein